VNEYMSVGGGLYYWGFLTNF